MKTDKYGHPRVRFSELPKDKRVGLLVILAIALLAMVFMPIFSFVVIPRENTLTLEEYLEQAEENYYDRESDSLMVKIAGSIIVPIAILLLALLVFVLFPRDYTKCPNGHVNVKKDKHPYPYCRECGVEMR